MQLTELLLTVEGAQVIGPADREITGLSYDSRLVEPGQAFFCIKGLITDGHLYVKDALERGAVQEFHL